MSDTVINKAEETSASAKRRVLSGMRPTGKLHLGHHVGALQNWIRLQNEYDCLFFVADWHALTTNYNDTSRIKQDTLEIAFDWLACGLDPKKCTMFVQSHVPQHAELHLLFSMITPLGWLERVPSYKEMRENLRDRDLDTYGFLGYPLLQAADILMYQAAFVPVGEDQVPHVELTREIARRFNVLYPLGQKMPVEGKKLVIKNGEWVDEQTVAQGILRIGIHPKYNKQLVFPEPQPLLTPSPRLPGLDGRKMSKSYGNAILLSEPAADVFTKVSSMVNDPARARRSDPGNPDVCPVGDLHKIFSKPDVQFQVDSGCRTAKIGCIECKHWAAAAVNQFLEPIRAERSRYELDPKLAWDILEDGSMKAGKAAESTIQEVRESMKMTHEFDPAFAPTVRVFTDDFRPRLVGKPEWWNLDDRATRGDLIRDFWIKMLPSTVTLRHSQGRTYLTQTGKRVGIPTARDLKKKDSWVFHPRNRTYDILVLLCFVNGTFEVIDLILPQRILQPNWKGLQTADNESTRIVRVTRKGEEFFLHIPNGEILNITEYRSNVQPLK